MLESLLPFTSPLARFYAAPTPRTVCVECPDKQQQQLTFHSSPSSLLPALSLLYDVPTSSKLEDFVQHLSRQDTSYKSGLSTLSQLAHSLVAHLNYAKPVCRYDNSAVPLATVHHALHIATRVALSIIDASSSLDKLPHVSTDPLIASILSRNAPPAGINVVTCTPFPPSNSRILPNTGVLIPVPSIYYVLSFNLEPTTKQTHRLCVITQPSAEDSESVSSLPSSVTLLIIEGAVHNLPHFGAFLHQCALRHIAVIDNVSRLECDRICKLSNASQCVDVESVLCASDPVDVEVVDVGDSNAHEERFTKDEDNYPVFVHIEDKGGGGGGIVNVLVYARTVHLAEARRDSVVRAINALSEHDVSGKCVPGGGAVEALIAMGLEEVEGMVDAEVGKVIGDVGAAFREMSELVLERAMESDPMAGYGALRKAIRPPVRTEGWFADERVVQECIGRAGVTRWDEWGAKRSAIERAMMLFSS